MTYPNTAAVATFRPTAARAIYLRFSGRLDPVLDVAAGFGGRLLGALATERQYVGIEPSGRTVAGLRRMEQMLRELGLIRVHPVVKHASAEMALAGLPSASFPLVFSSPPYFSRERYADEPSQSFRRYPTYESWRDGFLTHVIAEAHRLLERNGRLVLNVSDPFGLPIVRDTMDIARRAFRLERVCFLRLGRLPYRRTLTSAPFKLEPILVLQKRS